MLIVFGWLLAAAGVVELVWSGVWAVVAYVQIAVMGGIALVAYGLSRLCASHLARTLREQQVINVDGERGARRLRLRILDYFQWTVTVNADKGVAGGNVKLDFPIRSGLLLAACCLVIAYFIGSVSQFVVPGIFLYFGFHHFRKWLGAVWMLLRLRVQRRQTAPSTSTAVQLRPT